MKGTEYSVVIHPQVSGRITMNLSDVTMDDVLSSVEDLYGYDIVKAGKVLQVYPATIRTETIPVDYLQLTRKGRSLTTITTGSITNRIIIHQITIIQVLNRTIIHHLRHLLLQVELRLKPRVRAIFGKS